MQININIKVEEQSRAVNYLKHVIEAIEIAESIKEPLQSLYFGDDDKKNTLAYVMTELDFMSGNPDCSVNNKIINTRNNMLEQYQISENEAYFNRVLSFLGEGGMFVWKDLGEVFIKRGNKFQVSQKALDRLKGIVSKEYFKKTFELKP